MGILRSSIRGWGRSCIVMGGLFVLYDDSIRAHAQLTDLDPLCHARLVTEFLDSSLQGGCRLYRAFSQDSSAEGGQFSDQVSCTFSNRTTSFVLQRTDGSFTVDTRGMSGRMSYQSSASFVDSAQIVEACDAVVQTLHQIRGLSFLQLPARSQGQWASSESIALVTSTKRCQSRDGPELRNWVDLYRQEGRANSTLICLADEVVRSQNPSRVRQAIQGQLSGQQGIVLVGEEIPPFEYYRSTGWAPPFAPYKYGHTDLPYGALSDDFWSTPQRKNRAPLLNRVYFEKDYIYKPSAPTPWTFALDQLIEELKDQRVYTQDLWVARWVAPIESQGTALKTFIATRREYRPPVGLNLVLAGGSQSFMYNPMDYASWDVNRESIDYWADQEPHLKAYELYLPIDLDSFLSFIPPQTNLLILSEHGHSGGLSNVSIESLRRLESLPSIVSFDSCLTGAWGYAGSLESAFLPAVFTLRRPPLVIIASQGIKSYRTFGTPDVQTQSPFLTSWSPGQSLGRRQRDLINSELRYWKQTLSPDDFFDESVSQIFHSLSIFGDGSLEYAEF